MGWFDTLLDNLNPFKKDNKSSKQPPTPGKSNAPDRPWWQVSGVSALPFFGIDPVKFAKDYANGNVNKTGNPLVDGFNYNFTNAADNAKDFAGKVINQILPDWVIPVVVGVGALAVVILIRR